MTKIIGLTGGIGSGKSTVGKMFEKLNIPLYISDIEAKKILQIPETISEIVKKFGENIVVNNEIDRKKLALIVFENPEKLKILNTIIHPLVAIDFNNWLKTKLDYEFVIKETAILFENNLDSKCYKTITVNAPEKTRINRVMLRDGISYESVLNRIKNQWTDKMRSEKSDYVIENLTIIDTKKQVLKIYEDLKKK